MYRFFQPAKNVILKKKKKKTCIWNYTRRIYDTHWIGTFTYTQLSSKYRIFISRKTVHTKNIFEI